MHINIPTLLEMRSTLKNQKAWNEPLKAVINFAIDPVDPESTNEFTSKVQIVLNLLDNATEEVKKVHGEFNTFDPIINSIYFAVIVYIMQLANVADLFNANNDLQKINASVLIETIFRLRTDEYQNSLAQATDEHNLNLLMWAVHCNLEIIAELFKFKGANLNLSAQNVYTKTLYLPGEKAATLAFRLEYPAPFIAKLLTTESLADVHTYFRAHKTTSDRLVEICGAVGITPNEDGMRALAYLRNYARLATAKFLYRQSQQAATGTMLLSNAANTAVAQTGTAEQLIEQKFKRVMRNMPIFNNLMAIMSQLPMENKLSLLKEIFASEYLATLMQNCYQQNLAAALNADAGFPSLHNLPDLLEDWMQSLVEDQDDLEIEDVIVAALAIEAPNQMLANQIEEEENTENVSDLRNVMQ